MSQNQASGEYNNGKHLELALAHVCNAWIPPNAEFIEELRASIEKGEYQDNIGLLVKDLKSDISLFTYCVRQLSAVLRKSNPAVIINPVEVLTQAGSEGILQLLKASSSHISSYDISQMNFVQSRRLMHTMLSATTVELLAPKRECDSEVAFASALFRELGMTLVAWNYPHVYQKLALSLKPGDTLDASLTRMLGFSPSLLGLQIARQWQLLPEIRYALGDIQTNDKEVISTGTTLSKLCEVGQALARASDPDQYPSASDDWDLARREIELLLGKNGFKLLRDAMHDNCRHYMELSADLFQFPETLEPRTSFSIAEPKETHAVNQYVKHCPPLLKEQLTNLYSGMDTNAVSRDNIDSLIRKIIPHSGFNRGSIYLIEPESRMLTPRLTIGEAKLAEFPPIRYSDSQGSQNPILAAYRAGAPLMEENVELENRLVSYICGVLGHLQRVGVLYLEISPHLAKNRNFNAMVCFKAIREALNDCLNLS